MKPSPLLDFLKEIVLRFSTKSPKFFKIWQIVSGVFVVITGVPEVLNLLDIHLPDLFNDKLELIVKWASRGIFLMAAMTTQSTIVAVGPGGMPLKATNEEKLPFTASQEVKAMEKK